MGSFRVCKAILVSTSESRGDVAWLFCTAIRDSGLSSGHEKTQKGISDMRSEWSVPSLRGVSGNWTFYGAVVSARNISERIKPSHEIREAKALEDFLKRTLKPRVTKIARYLSKRDDRFF